MQFTDDPHVQDTLRFLMTREIAHFQMFAAALETIQPNFPPGILQGDPRYTHSYFNLSNGTEVRGPWNEGQGPWGKGEHWDYIDDPIKHVVDTNGEVDHQPTGSKMTQQQVKKKDKALSKERSLEVSSMVPKGENQWSVYPQDALQNPKSLQ